MSDRLLTAEQVRARLGIGRTLVYSLVRHGRIPGVVRIGRMVRFRADQIEEWITSGCPTDPPQAA